MDLEEFVLQGVRVMSNDTKKIGLMGWSRQEMDKTPPKKTIASTNNHFVEVL
jgi:hypothetical protein